MYKSTEQRMTDIIDYISVEYDTTFDKVWSLCIKQVAQIVNILDLYL